jgi:hypothetical protein
MNLQLPLGRRTDSSMQRTPRSSLTLGYGEDFEWRIIALCIFPGELAEEKEEGFS